MGAYAIWDFTETLSQTGVDPKTIKSVIYGFGENGDGSEWEGGFVFETNEGAFGMTSGWCDYTGWGCQDGAMLCWFASRPAPEEVCAAYDEAWSTEDGFKPDDLDADPGDLNRWLQAGCPDVYDWEHGRA